MINVEKSLKPVNIFNKIKLFNCYDTINVLLILLGTSISSIEMIELRNNFEIDNFRFILYNLITSLIIIGLNVYQIINRRKIIKIKKNLKKKKILII